MRAFGQRSDAIGDRLACDARDMSLKLFREHVLSHGQISGRTTKSLLEVVNRERYDPVAASSLLLRRREGAREKARARERERERERRSWRESHGD